MEIIQYGSDVLYVENGRITGANTPLLNLANTILEGAFGKFGNSEVYPDMDASIAHYVETKLTGIK
jgi:hypothetical protein